MFMNIILCGSLSSRHIARANNTKHDVYDDADEDENVRMCMHWRWDATVWGASEMVGGVERFDVARLCWTLLIIQQSILHLFYFNNTIFPWITIHINTDAWSMLNQSFARLQFSELIQTLVSRRGKDRLRRGFCDKERKQKEENWILKKKQIFVVEWFLLLILVNAQQIGIDRSNDRATCGIHESVQITVVSVSSDRWDIRMEFMNVIVFRGISHCGQCVDARIRGRKLSSFPCDRFG